MKKRNIISIMIVLVISLSCSIVAVADTYPDFQMESDLVISPKAIADTYVTAKRTSSTKLSYTIRSSLYPTADSVTVKVWKCTYSSSQGAWVTEGAATSYSYKNCHTVTINNTFNVTSGKSYKVKVTITEKRGSVTNSKTLYSVAV